MGARCRCQHRGMESPPGLEVRRDESRFCSERDGITTLHSFSHGIHYDAANMGFGPIIAINDERVEPGRGYETHHHADVEILTWVLDGVLAHEDSAGARGAILPGTLHWLSAGDGVQHAEHNASADEPLHFIQTMLRSTYDGEPVYASLTAEDVAEPFDFDGRVDVTLQIVAGRRDLTIDGPALVHVTAGEIVLGSQVLRAGDEARIGVGGPYDLSAPESSGVMIWRRQG